MDIKKTIEKLPQCPGVYLMKDKNGRILYVGKAAFLKKRVSSYFNRPQNSKNQALLERVASIEVELTPSEHQALLLESRLIKKFKPHYNISLKDDKSFPFIKITLDKFPRVFIGRKKQGEKVEYIGPFTNTKLLRLSLKLLRKTFNFADCRIFPKKECLDYHLGLCSAPCVGKISFKDYRRDIIDLRYFIERGNIHLLKELEKRMQRCSQDKRYEDALKIRDKVKALSLLFQQMKLNWSGIPPAIAGCGTRLVEGILLPKHLEAFDISNLAGEEAVGSMVTFINGVPDKSGYRRFKIKTVKGPDDYSMMKEVLLRRYSRLIEENAKLPDLIVIDGGKGHLGVAVEQLQNLKLEIPIIAIAKENELIYTVGHNASLKLKRDDCFLQLVQRARDEAHRFALSYHKLLRKKKSLGT